MQKFTHNPLFRSKYCHTPPSFVTCTVLSTTTLDSRSGGPPGVFVVPSYVVALEAGPPLSLPGFKFLRNATTFPRNTWQEEEEEGGY